MMQIPYPKPKVLSDPGQDWLSHEAEFQAILAQDPDDLTQRDFDIIFAPFLPAANYEEGVYYLDACFRRMARRQDVVESNLCEGVFWFIDNHQDRLEKDGLLASCLEWIADLWRIYTSDFELVRLTDAELEHYHIREDWRELAKYSRTVHDLVDVLIEYDLYAALLDDLLASLAETDFVGSCWWVEITYHARWWYILHSPGSKESVRQQHILNRLLGLEAYSKHERQARDYVRSLGFADYHKRVSIV